jgi:hypothetical protein
MSTKPKKLKIDDEIQHILEALKTMPVDSKEYFTTCDNLAILMKAKNESNSNKVSMDTIVLAATNIVGILLVLNYEYLHVVSKTALAQVAKLRL